MSNFAGRENVFCHFAQQKKKWTQISSKLEVLETGFLFFAFCCFSCWSYPLTSSRPSTSEWQFNLPLNTSTPQVLCSSIRMWQPFFFLNFIAVHFLAWVIGRIMEGKERQAPVAGHIPLHRCTSSSLSPPTSKTLQMQSFL